MQSLLESLYDYNDWANAKIVSLCDGLSDEQLDQPRPIGFGSLRATIFHILTADEVWMERWENVPWRPFPTEPDGMSIEDMAEKLRAVSSRRKEIIRKNRQELDRIVEYEDSGRNAYQHQLYPLMLHVFMHGVHHRAQCLQYLKPFGRTVPAGLDYVFYRLAKGSTKQSPDAIEQMTAFGLGVNETLGEDVAWEPASMQRLFRYGDWAMDKVLTNAATLDDETLDRPIDFGHGTIRKNLLHLFNAEKWWVINWTVEPQPFPNTPLTTSITELMQLWKDNAAARDRYLDQVSDTEAQREIEVVIGGPPTRFKVVETAVQLTMHGTHHRAQIVNQFRQVDSAIGNIDLLYALADLDAPGS